MSSAREFIFGVVIIGLLLVMMVTLYCLFSGREGSLVVYNQFANLLLNLFIAFFVAVS